jgi:hypothetical protein
MAFGSWLSKLFGGGKKPKPPEVPASSKRDQWYEPPTQAVEEAAGEFLLGNEQNLEQIELVESLQDIGASADEIATVLEARWTVLASSNVNEIRYLWQDKILEVEFLSGALYQYFQVPVEVFLEFLRAGSPGRFVWNYLRDVYEYARMDMGTAKKTQPYPRNANVIRTRRDLDTAEGRKDFPIGGFKSIEEYRQSKIGKKSNRP